MNDMEEEDLFGKILADEDIVYVNAYEEVYAERERGPTTHPADFISSWRQGLWQGSKMASELFEYEGLASEALKHAGNFGNKRENTMKRVALDLLHLLREEPGILKSSEMILDVCSSGSESLEHLTKIRAKARQLGSLLDVFVTGEAISDLYF